MNDAFTDLVKSMDDIFNKRVDTSTAHEKAFLLSKFNDPDTLAKGIPICYAYCRLTSQIHDSTTYSIEVRKGTMFTDGNIFLVANRDESLASFHVYANGQPANREDGWRFNVPLEWWYPDQPEPDLTQFV